jgi:MtaA/CmuA family methyltransferase
MNTYARVMGALRRERVDRTPVTAFLTAINTSMMKWAGEDFATVRSSPERYAKLAAAPWEVYGIENVKIPFDMTVEPEVLGAEIDFGSSVVLPQVRRHAFSRPEEFAIPGAWQNRGRVPFFREVVAILRRRYERQVPICHLCDGPFTLANMLFGFENLLIWMTSEPDAYARAMDRTTAFCIEYCRMLEEEGVDVIQFGEAAASGDLISGRQYRDFIAPYHSRLGAALRTPNVIHICGNINGHFAALAQTGLGGVSFDFKADPATAMAHCKGKMALVGYVPIPLLNDGRPDEVKAFGRECVAAGIDLLSAGCAWPPTVPDGNARALVVAAGARPNG